MSDQQDDNGDKGNVPRRNPPSPKMSRGVFGWVIILSFAMMLVLLLNKQWDPVEKIDLNQFWTLVDNGEIEELTIQEESIKGIRAKGSGDEINAVYAFQVDYPPAAIDGELITMLRSKLPNSKIQRQKSGSYLVTFLIGLLPWVLLFAFVWFFFIRQLRGAGGAGMLGNFGRSRHRVTTKEHTNVTFKDVAGIEEAKDEVAEIIEFLKNPKKFQRLGGRIPRGVLLLGEPGCGKTLLAKAIAGEAEVPFFSISGSDFVEMFVGVGASRVRDLFKQAKESSPCIIFLDEIDAVGRRRGAGFSSGGHDEREQTLNAILVEMDGFETSDQVIVIAATNRVDVLDPALIRPGRFDRQVVVSLPDVKGRMEILRVHARKIKLGPDVDMKKMARGTPMFSGADLAAIINEAALQATMADKDFVEMEDLEEARDKVRWGRAKKSRQVDEKDKVITAYHEAGHAVVQVLLKDADPLHKVSIIPRGPMGGATFSLPERDRMVLPKNYMDAMLKVTFGGRIAEELFCADISSGASSDIKQATEIVRRMVTEWGMSEKLGFIYYGGNEGGGGFLDMMGGGHEYSDETASLIDAEVKRFVDGAYEETRQLVIDNKDKVEAVAQALLKHETLSGDEVHALMRGEELPESSVADLLDEATTLPPKQDLPTVTDTPPQPDLDSGPLPQPG